MAVAEVKADFLAVFFELLPCPFKFVIPVPERLRLIEVHVELSIRCSDDHILRPQKAKNCLVSFGYLLALKMLDDFHHTHHFYLQVLQLFVWFKQVSLKNQNFHVLIPAVANARLNRLRLKVLC
jgi:hypothetical protein